MYTQPVLGEDYSVLLLFFSSEDALAITYARLTVNLGGGYFTIPNPFFGGRT